MNRLTQKIALVLIGSGAAAYSFWPASQPPSDWDQNDDAPPGTSTTLSGTSGRSSGVPSRHYTHHWFWGTYPTSGARPSSTPGVRSGSTSGFASGSTSHVGGSARGGFGHAGHAASS